ncbi:MAG: arylesterase [Nitrospirae bacterium]|nr:arylesterase [Nitrospirota bacterium]
MQSFADVQSRVGWLLFALSAGLIAAAPPDLASDHEHNRPVIVAFGDSLTSGLGLPVDEAYPAQLERRLREAGYPHRVINAGVSGDTTAGGVRRVDAVLSHQPAIVIVEFGANDGLRGLSISQTRENLANILDRLRSAGARVILAGMKLPPNYGPEYTGQFAAIFPELARTHGATLIPFFLDGVATRPQLNQTDGIHPTAEGYSVTVNTLWPLLEPLLKSSGPARRPAPP